MERSEYEHMADAELWHPWFLGRRQLVRTLIRRYAPATSRPLLLDAGCGTGWNLADYRQLADAYGIEPDGKAAAMSRARSGAPLAQGDLRYLPFRSGSFDVVVCTDVLEHISEDAAALGELARVLKPAGTLILTVPACPWAWSEHDRYLGHVRRYNCRRLLRLAWLAGLRAVHLSRYNSLLGPALVAWRRATSRSAGRSDVGRPVPYPLRRPLLWLFRLEASLSARLQLPFGLTLVLVACRSDRRRPLTSFPRPHPDQKRFDCP